MRTNISEISIEIDRVTLADTGHFAIIDGIRGMGVGATLPHVSKLSIIEVIGKDQQTALSEYS